MGCVPSKKATVQRIAADDDDLEGSSSEDPATDPSIAQRLTAAVELTGLIQLRTASLQAETAAKIQFYETAQRFDAWLHSYRGDPPPFHEADTCEYASCGKTLRKFKRHHCRRCGISLCGKHSEDRHLIQTLGFCDTPVRTCPSCSGLLTAGSALWSMSMIVEPSTIRAEWQDLAVGLGIERRFAAPKVLEMLEQAERLGQLRTSTQQFDALIEGHQRRMAPQLQVRYEDCAVPRYWGRAADRFEMNQVDVTAELKATMQASTLRALPRSLSEMLRRKCWGAHGIRSLLAWAMTATA